MRVAEFLFLTLAAMGWAAIMLIKLGILPV